MAKNLIKVGDYYYASRRHAQAAENELRAVEYMRENLDLDKPEELFAAYEQMIERRIFKTEVGIDFLKDIREYLQVYATLAYKLPPIYPIEGNAITRRTQKAVRARKEERRRALKMSRADKDIDPVKARKAAVEVLSREPEEKRQKRRDAKDRGKTSSRERDRSDETARKGPVSYVYRELFYLTLTLCVVFAIAIGCMFYIASTSDSVTILNYENEIIDRYATWEQQLAEKEQELRQLEKAMNE